MERDLSQKLERSIQKNAELLTIAFPNIPQQRFAEYLSCDEQIIAIWQRYNALAPIIDLFLKRMGNVVLPPTLTIFVTRPRVISPPFTGFFQEDTFRELISTLRSAALFFYHFQKQEPLDFFTGEFSWASRELFLRYAPDKIPQSLIKDLKDEDQKKLAILKDNIKAQQKANWEEAFKMLSEDTHADLERGLPPKVVDKKRKSRGKRILEAATPEIVARDRLTISACDLVSAYSKPLHRRLLVSDILALQKGKLPFENLPFSKFHL